MPLAEALSDHLGWDREPKHPEEWQRLAEERPLEALWLSALSEDKAVRKGFPKLAAAAIQAFRASPACPAPSWTFVDMLLDLQASYVREIDRLEKGADDLERRGEAERQRSEDLRDELKRLRRENAELRAERAAAEKRAAAAEEGLTRAAQTRDRDRLDEAERRFRKAEKEAEHLRREIERRDAPLARESGAPAPPIPAVAPAAAVDRGRHESPATRAPPDPQEALQEGEDRRVPHPRGQCVSRGR
jgi:hypothetical protein